MLATAPANRVPTRYLAPIEQVLCYHTERRRVHFLAPVALDFMEFGYPVLAFALFLELYCCTAVLRISPSRIGFVFVQHENGAEPTSLSFRVLRLPLSPIAIAIAIAICIAVLA